MGSIRPTSSRVVTEPTGQLATNAQLALQVGGIEAAPVADKLARTIGAAVEALEGRLGVYLRTAELEATADDLPVDRPLRLPGGPARTVTVTVDGVQQGAGEFDVVQLASNLSAVVLKDSGGDAVVSYTVGLEAPVPAIVELAVLQLAATMWQNPDGTGVDVALARGRTQLSGYALPAWRR